MFELPDDQTKVNERLVLRKLRVWIVALAVACLLTGIGVGAMLSGRPTVAQNDLQIAHAPEALSASFSEIARRVEPAVVNIETLTAAPEIADKDGDDKEDQSSTNPLLDMFRHQSRRPSRGVGSGFIVDPKGYILTNEHVIEGATRLIVGLQSGEKYRGKLIGIDDETDVAVIKIESPQNLPTVTLGDSNAAQVGDWVLAVGSPFGLDQTVTAGIISKKEGINLDSVKDEFAKVYGLPDAKGAIVMDVTQSKDGELTPAAKAGILSNDIITEFNSQPVKNAQDLIQKVAGSPVGQSVTLTFLREADGKLEKHTVNVVLGERPPAPTVKESDSPTSPKMKDSDPKGNGLHLGITLAELTTQLISEKHLTGLRGLYVREVDPNGLAAEVRVSQTGQQALSEGDVITRINRVPVSALAEFQRVISGLKPGDPIVLQVSRYSRDADRVAQRIVQFTYQ